MINNVSQKLHELIESISLNVTTLNRTLTSRIDWLSGDQKTNGVSNYECLHYSILNIVINIILYFLKLYYNLKLG